MKLTRAASYALHAMVHLASLKTKSPLPSHEVARARQIPERFLLKVLKPLVSAGLLVSVKGPNGGYRLARPAKEITMLDIIEAVEGPIRGQVTFQPEDSSPKLAAHFERLTQQIANLVRKQLASVKLSQMAAM